MEKPTLYFRSSCWTGTASLPYQQMLIGYIVLRHSYLPDDAEPCETRAVSDILRLGGRVGYQGRTLCVYQRKNLSIQCGSGEHVPNRVVSNTIWYKMSVL